MQHLHVTADWVLGQVMDLQRRVGHLEARMDHDKKDAPSWLKSLPLSELLLLATLIIGGLMLHLTPEDWRAIVLAKAGVRLPHGG